MTDPDASVDAPVVPDDMPSMSDAPVPPDGVVAPDVMPHVDGAPPPPPPPRAVQAAMRAIRREAAGV